MTGLDFILIAIISFFILMGIVSGFISSIISILSTIGGIALAFLYNEKLAVKLPFEIHIAKILSFIIIFALVLLVGKILSFILRKMLFGSLKLINRIMGGVIGLIEGFVVCFLIVYIGVFFLGDSFSMKKNSFSYFIYETGRKVVNEFKAEKIKKYKGERLEKAT